MRLDRVTSSIAVLLSVVAIVVAASARTLTTDARQPLPTFTHTARADWLNGAPLTVEALRGHVALVHVWAFACSNCYRSMPWLRTLEQSYRDRGLIVVGVHTPELAEEEIPERVAAKVRELGLTHPVMLDGDSSYWRALRNQYWPAWYVVDADGRVRTVVIGEVHAGDSRARAVEGAIDTLLAELRGGGGD
jgi:thiol-disulfide isomerase/thioredoxin